MNHLLFEISCFVTTIDINKESDKIINNVHLQVVVKYFITYKEARC